MLMKEFENKFLEKVANAATQESVKSICKNSIQVLKAQGLKKERIFEFIGVVLTRLESFNPMEKDADQWSNIQTAKIQYRRIQSEIEVGVH